MPPPSFSPLFDFFLSRPILSSSRYSSFFRSVSRRNTRERHGGGRVAYRYNYARASISDLDCVKDTSTQGKGGKEGGQIMHAIDSGHFVISIQRSSTVLITFAGRLIMRCYDLLFLFLIYPLSLPFLSLSFLSFFNASNFSIPSVYRALIGETFSRVSRGSRRDRRSFGRMIISIIRNRASS